MNKLKLELILNNHAEVLPDGKVKCKVCAKQLQNKHGFFVHYTAQHAPDDGRYFVTRPNGKFYCCLSFSRKEHQGDTK